MTKAIIIHSQIPPPAISTIDVPPWVYGTFGVFALGVVLGYVRHVGQKIIRRTEEWQQANPQQAQESYLDDIQLKVGQALELLGSMDPDAFKRQYLTELTHAIQAKGRVPDLSRLENPVFAAEAIANPNGLDMVCQDCNHDGVPDRLQKPPVPALDQRLRQTIDSIERGESMPVVDAPSIDPAALDDRPGIVEEINPWSEYART